MNRFFEFSRRQLYFLGVLSLSAVVMASWLTYERLSLERRALPLYAGAAVDRPVSIPATVGPFILDPNTAPADSLELLPGIGPTRAAAIVACRDTLPFAGPEDLLNVDGIGPRTLEKMRPFLKVGAP